MMDKYIITKRKKYPRWMSAGATVGALAFLAMDICRIGGDPRHTEA